MDHVYQICCALLGTLIASVLACVPALHVYNTAGLILLLYVRLGSGVPAQYLAMLFLGMTVGYAVVNSVPSLFFGAPDESAVWVVLPGQRYLVERRGYEAAVLICIGSIGGVAALGLFAPLSTAVLAPIIPIVQRHAHWLLGLIVVYVLLSEWPKGVGREKTVRGRLWGGWKSILAGLATFSLSGLLGILLTHRPLIPLGMSYQGLMPAFVGLYAIPWILQTLVSRTRMPEQYVCRSVDLTPWLAVRGIGAGLIGGMMAAVLPVITGGMGALIAAHATAQRDDRLFLVSQGASKVVYYVGALLLLYVPRLHLVRGGMASMLRSVYVPHTPEEYWLAVGAAALCCALASALLMFFSRQAINLLSRIPCRWVSWGTLTLLFAMIGGLTGWRGLLAMLAGTGIGLLPIVFHSRRMNCMGILLVPTLLRMAGLGPAVAGWLGLA